MKPNSADLADCNCYFRTFIRQFNVAKNICEVSSKMVYNYYQTLRVQRIASMDEITDAYKELALQYYKTKDFWVGASVAFRKAAEAYEVLSDPQKREVFDGLWDWETGRLLRGRSNFPWHYDGDGMETYDRVFGRNNDLSQAVAGNPPHNGVNNHNYNYNNNVQNGYQNAGNSFNLQNVQNANNVQNVVNNIQYGNHVVHGWDWNEVMYAIIALMVLPVLWTLIQKYGFIKVLLTCGLFAMAGVHGKEFICAVIALTTFTGLLTLITKYGFIKVLLSCGLFAMVGVQGKLGWTLVGILVVFAILY